MSPRNEPRQAVLDARVEVWPPARTYRYEDYWGTVGDRVRRAQRRTRR